MDKIAHILWSASAVSYLEPVSPVQIPVQDQREHKEKNVYIHLSYFTS